MTKQIILCAIAALFGTILQKEIFGNIWTVNKAIPSSAKENQALIDDTCPLSAIYVKAQITPLASLAIDQFTWQGSDSIAFLHFEDSTLIKYALITNNDQGMPETCKIYNDSHLSEVYTFLYRGNNSLKTKNWKKVNPPTSYDSTNAKKEWRYDVQGNIVEYKNSSIENKLMNHLTYSNTYENGMLVKTIRIDRTYDSFNATIRYGYNHSNAGQLTWQSSTDARDSTVTTYTYDAKNTHTTQKTYVYGKSDTCFTKHNEYTYNKNGVTLKKINYNTRGQKEIRYVLFMDYTCD